VFIERLWRTVKYLKLHLHAYRDVREAQQQLSRYLACYNARRIHHAREYRTPDELHFATANEPLAAAAHLGLRREQLQLPPCESVAKTTDSLIPALTLLDDGPNWPA
jgi:hypothetical protein